MTLENALALRAQLQEGSLYESFNPTHTIYIFRWDLEPRFRMALIGLSNEGRTPQELRYLAEWVENVGFDDYEISSTTHADKDDWMLVEVISKAYIQDYTMVQRLATWAGLLDRYNQNPLHQAWPPVPQPNQLEVFFKAT